MSSLVTDLGFCGIFFFFFCYEEVNIWISEVLVCVCFLQLNSKVLKGVKIVGICTQQLHTVLCSKQTVYTFGHNAGQLGNLISVDLQHSAFVICRQQLFR